MSNLHSKDFQLKLKQGVVANINTDATKGVAVTGEPHYTTDTKDLYIFDGTTNVKVGSSVLDTGATGTFTTVDGKTVTVTGGIITNIV